MMKEVTHVLLASCLVLSLASLSASFSLSGGPFSASPGCDVDNPSTSADVVEFKLKDNETVSTGPFKDGEASVDLTSFSLRIERQLKKIDS